MEGGEQKESHKLQVILRLFSFLFFFYFLFSFGTAGAKAATLFLSPNSGGYKVGQSFNVSIFVSSPDAAMNAASGVINFPQDKLEIISLSKSGSIMSLWVAEPGFSNASGAVNFEGIILNPGFTGSGGKIITVSFKVKSAGSASLLFTSGSVLANDGLGTNILTGMGSAKYDLTSTTPTQPSAEEETPAAAEQTPSGRAPSAPTVISSTHPDQESWYSVNVPKFNWTVPLGVTGARLLVGRIPQAYPSVTYIPPISSRELGELEDGVWYFHLWFRNAFGWGDVSHFKFQIDTKPPETFKISQPPGADPTDPSVELTFEAADKTSGLDHYEIQFNNLEPQIWQDDGSHVYRSPVLPPGQYTVSAKAVDKAGNFLVQTAEFTIEPLKTPEIIEYPRLPDLGDILTIKGLAVPQAKAMILIEAGDKVVYSREALTDLNGEFYLVVPDKLPPDRYTIRAQISDARGAVSEFSDKLDFIIHSKRLWHIATWPLDFIVTVLLLVVALIVLISLTLFKGRKKSRSARHFNRVEAELNSAIDALRRDIKDRMNLLVRLKTRKKLTGSELRMIKRAKRTYRQADKTANKLKKSSRK